MGNEGRQPTDFNEKIFLIGEASRKAGPSPNTIKAYAKAGIVEDVRDGRDRRVFSRNDIAKLKAYYRARNPERIDR